MGGKTKQYSLARRSLRAPKGNQQPFQQALRLRGTMWTRWSLRRMRKMDDLQAKPFLPVKQTMWISNVRRMVQRLPKVKTWRRSQTSFNSDICPSFCSRCMHDNDAKRYAAKPLCPSLDLAIPAARSVHESGTTNDVCQAIPSPLSFVVICLNQTIFRSVLGTIGSVRL